jgi:hypothetical protein
MRLPGEAVFFPAAVLIMLVGFTAGGSLYTQKPITVRELSAQRAELDGKTVRIKGILASGHVGTFLKDGSEEVAARLRFEALPQSLRRNRVIKNGLYHKLFDLANSIPDPDQPRAKYEVELIGVVTVLKKPSFDVYKESPLEIYPLQVLRVTSIGGVNDRGGTRGETGESLIRTGFSVREKAGLCCGLCPCRVRRNLFPSRTARRPTAAKAFADRRHEVRVPERSSCVRALLRFAVPVRAPEPFVPGGSHAFIAPPLQVQ